jgi:hypothetical protein
MVEENTEKEIGNNMLYNLFKGFQNYSLSYVYKGIFNPTLTDKILSLTETNMTITGEVSKTQKKVYFVMVESLQNITRHQDLSQTEDNQAFFVVQNKNGIYDLTSGNVIEQSNISDLKTQLDKINSLNPDELKDHYKHVLENTGMSDKGGAGLGLIEMARRSGNKLAYDFETLNENLSYFYFKSKIAVDDEGDESARLKDIKQLHEFTREHHVSMIYQGIFTHDNLKSLLTMTEGSVAKNDIAFKRKAVNVMVELLQNICNHAGTITPEIEGKPGMLVVSTTEKGCNIMSGNYIDNATLPLFTAKVDKVNACNDGELDDLYTEIIMKEHEPGQKGAGLGFIDMRLKSGSQIDYTSKEINNDFSFISITVFIPF